MCRELKLSTRGVRDHRQNVTFIGNPPPAAWRLRSTPSDYADYGGDYNGTRIAM